MATKRLCAVDGCGKPHYSRGYCDPHYQRLKKHGTPLGGVFYADNSGSCAVDGCTGKASARGFCKKHYRRWERSGSPHGTNSYDGEQEAWLRSHAEFQSDECLVWPFFVNQNGYGVARRHGMNIGAHRFMCEIAHGEQPAPKLETAHSCGNRPCVNPRHLRWATRSENMLEKTAHGTQLLGERHPHHKLTAAQVSEIRKLEGNSSLKAAAQRYGVHISTIHSIWRRKSWAWL